MPTSRPNAVSIRLRVDRFAGRRLVVRRLLGAFAALALGGAFPWASAPAYLLRDHDRAYGHVFITRVTAMGIRDRPISPGSPWQNGIAESLIGTLRCECLDHMVIFGEAHLRRILSAYAVYYNQTRTHLALNKDCPLGRPIQRFGRVAAPPFWLAYIISMSGYDFRKGHPLLRRGGTPDRGSPSHDLDPAVKLQVDAVHA